MSNIEKGISSEEIFQGRIIRLRRDVVELPNGAKSTREVIEHPGGVAIVAINEDNKILLVHQYRRPIDKEILEIPAGKLDYGEDHRACGIRELEEETGYKAGNFEYLGCFYSTPGFCDEIIHIYYANKLTKGDINLDEDEFLDVLEFSIDEVMSMILSGEIKDFKSVTGILLAKEIKNLK